MKYRADIDGLRAIAVWSVLLYHLRFQGFNGGFVGVDIFFVISGYLITRKIVDDLDVGTFSFKTFYLDRARRILPALFVTLSACFIVGTLLFTSDLFFGLSASLLAALLSVSNLYFEQRSGYFDISASLRPLLHTWSLGVEEQFYFFHPLALFLIYRAFGKRAIMWWLLGCAAFSLVLNQFFNANAIFYLAPFRVFEFAIGALILWAPAPSNERARPWLEPITVAAFGMIAFSVYTYSEKMTFPSYNALIPCIGAALLIYAGTSKCAVAVLANKPMNRIGKVSYSLYLVHWPIIVFWQYYQNAALSFEQKISVLIVSYVLAEVLYRYVEQQFRGKTPRFKIVVPALTAATVLAFIGASGLSKTAWSWRLDPTGKEAVLHFNGPSSDIAGRLGCDVFCEFGNVNGAKILIVGDSHVDHYTTALKRIAGDRYHFYLVYGPSCFFGATMISRPPDKLAEECRSANAKLRNVMASNEFEAIIIGERWPGYRSILFKNGQNVDIGDENILFPMMLNDIDRLYKGFEGPIVFVEHAPNTVTGCHLRPTFFKMPCQEPSLTEHDTFKKAFLSFSKTTHLNVSLVRPVETICPHEKCLITDKDGRLLYTDDTHLSIYGANLIAPQILRDIERPHKIATQ